MKNQITISDEAVQAAKGVLYYANPNDVETALTAALPFLTGVKVKGLKWELASGDHYAECSGTHYNIYETRPDFWNCVTVKPGNVRLATNVSLETAKAAAQADYDARILSAIEPAPSPRAQALEEATDLQLPDSSCDLVFERKETSPLSQKLARALRELLHAVCGETGFANSVRQESGHAYPWPALDIAEAAAIRALSSQPVADGERERLRFEGDLDKWMKIIGAGITGYQPEAYAIMDLACHELVKLREENNSLRLVSSQTVENGLPQDVINLVIAAREAFDIGILPEDEEHNLDKALEPFASRVLYENEPEVTRPTGGSNHGE